MRAAFLVLVAYAAVLGCTSPLHDYVLHESRDGMHGSLWKRSMRANPEAMIPLRIRLTQSNLHTAYDKLMDIAHPSSANYGRHLTPDEVISLFAPKEETIGSVVSWLVNSGIDESRITFYKNKGWVSVYVPISQAESLLRTQYYEIEDRGKIRLGCDEYHLPKHISEHVDYITPGVKPSPPLKKRSITSPDAKAGFIKPHKLSPSDGSWTLPSLSQNLSAEVCGCSRNFTPACYRALYGIPAEHITLPGNSVGLYESGDTYAQHDIDAFYAAYAPYIPNRTFPEPAYIDGAKAPVRPSSKYNTGESDIDIAIISSLVYPQIITLYQTDDREQTNLQAIGQLSGFLNTFLDALDGSYCNYSAYGITGDSPGIDAEYPDPLASGYKGSRMCGTYKPAKVISFSYGEAEADLPKKYIQRQCNEWMKLGLQGHTNLIASGDFGVGGFAGDASESGCLSGYGQNQTIYTPDYPSYCPYVTSVGGAQLQANQTINDPESAMQTPLHPSPDPSYLLSSGGGFSNYFPAPDYQKRAVEKYFDEHDPGHPYYVANRAATNVGEHGGIYNRAGRGFPDVSANGASFQTFNNGTDTRFFGTSLAAPLWAAVVTLVNQERQAAGKAPVGFLNPALYAHPHALTDVRNGSNPNCGSGGFAAVEGWDPVTGLGTPKYPELLKLFLSLP